MQTNNPVLTRMEKEAARNGGYAGFGSTAQSPAPSPEQLQDMYNVPAAEAPPVPPTAVGTGPVMTIADVIAKSGLMFAIVVVAAFGSWQLEVPTGVVLVAMLGGFGLGMWGAVSATIRPAVYLGYALLMGIALGGISLWYYNFANADPTGPQNNIVVQAVLGTFAAFAAMLFLYATRIIKVGNTFRKVMMIGMVGYLFVALASLVSSFFGVGEGFGFYGTGGLGLLLCVAGVGLAAFSLALDFDAIERAMAAGAPEQESWRAAFGIMVTLVWLYLELLRLMAILNRS
jgi:uncharacterized YccA/Bax inhibitor family protein